MGKENYLISRTYTEIELIGDQGDYADDNGFDFEDQSADLQDVLRELEDCTELSCCPVTREFCAHVWASTEAQQDMYTGISRSESVHIKGIDGKPLSSRRMYRIYRLAGLA